MPLLGFLSCSSRASLPLWWWVLLAVSRSACTDLVLHAYCHSAALGFLDFNAAGDAGSSVWIELDMLALSWVLSAG